MTITIDLKQSPRLYCDPIPQGMAAIGVVDRDGFRGALMHVTATSLYVQANAGVIRTLPQREVRSALAAATADPAALASLAARRAGSTTSDAKAAAARANGRRGGRPRR